MIINVSESAKKAIQYVVEQEKIENPQVCVYSESNEENESEFKLLLLNGIPKVEDIVFDFDVFKVTVNTTCQKNMLGKYLIDFIEDPYSAFKIEEVSEED